MKTAETQTITLVERFKTAEEKVSKQHNGEERRWYPEHNQMKWELGQLLSNEISAPYMLKYDNGIQLLEDYRENFEWESEFSVRACWDINPATYTDTIECSSPEEIREYLAHRKELEIPDWEKVDDECDIEYGRGFNGDKEIEAVVRVSNLRLKQKKHQYAVLLVVECEKALPDLEFLMKQLLENSPFYSKAEVLSFTDIP